MCRIPDIKFYDIFKDSTFYYGSISMLIVNFVLDGLEKLLEKYQRKQIIDRVNVSLLKDQIGKGTSKFKIRGRTFLQFVRYLDVFVIILNNKNYIKDIMQDILSFLRARGLSLEKVKCSIIKMGHRAKFDFLGFTFINLEYFRDNRFFARCYTAQGLKASHRGIFIIPSRISVDRMKVKIKEVFKNVNFTPYHIIKILNPLILS